MKNPALRAALEEIRTERKRIALEIEKLDGEYLRLGEAYQNAESAEHSIRAMLGEGEEDAQLSLTAPHKAARPSNGKYPKTSEAVYATLRDNEGTRMTASRLQEILEVEGKLRPDLKQPYGVVLESAKRLAAKHAEIVSRRSKGKIFFSYRSQDREEEG